MPRQFSWPAFTGPSSKVITTVKDWQDSGILVPHEMFRWWNGQLWLILEEFHPHNSGEHWKTNVLFDFLDNYYCTCINHHHHSEELIYNPGIEAKLGRSLEGNISSDHKELTDRLDRVGTFRDPISAGDRAALDNFKQHMKDLFTFMEDHLAMEEKVYPEAFHESRMTEEEEGALVGKILESLGLDGNKRMLPPIIYVMCMWWGEEKMMEWFNTKVPPPIRMLHDTCWINDFYQNQLRVLEALKQKDEFNVEAATCGCTIA